MIERCMGRFVDCEDAFLMHVLVMSMGVVLFCSRDL